MNTIIKICCTISITLLIGCGTNESGKTTEPSLPNTPVSSATVMPGDDIIGEWEQKYTCFDKNGNYILEPEEKKPSNTRLGFDWFKFNADGSCLRDKDVKFEGTYEIQEKNGKKKLLIQSGDNLRYTLAELTDKQLILGADGAFIVFERIK